jgi:ribosomal protein S18 acetylase RimI-like enzyme
MLNTNIEFVDSLPREIEVTLEKGQKDYESSHGVVCSYQPFWLLVHQAGGATVGVLAYYTAYAEIYVDDIWIAERHRGTGLGRKLLTALEYRFQGQGYNNINLVTNQFQAAGFYKKCGYEVEFVRTNKYHPKLSKTFFIKYFESTNQTQGILTARQSKT